MPRPLPGRMMGSQASAVLPCEPMAADTWRTVRERAVFYFVRRNWAVTVLASYRTHVTDADLRALAATVGVRDPAFFLGCPRTPAAANCPERPSPGDRRFHRGASGYPR